jgi:hypothetical protein
MITVSTCRGRIAVPVRADISFDAVCSDALIGSECTFSAAYDAKRAAAELRRRVSKPS